MLVCTLCLPPQTWVRRPLQKHTHLGLPQPASLPGFSLISSPRTLEAAVPTLNYKFSTNSKTKAGRVKFQKEENMCLASLCPKSLSILLLATR